MYEKYILFEMKRILIVHNYYQIPGGEDSVVKNEIQMLRNHGHEVYLYSRNNSELNTYNILQKMLMPLDTIYSFKTRRDIKRIIEEKNIDIVHVHNTLNLISPSVYYAAISSKVPVIQTIHNFRLLCPGATFFRNNNICEECLKKGLKCAIRYKCYRKSTIQTIGCVLSTKYHRFRKIYSKLNYICLTDFNKNKLLELKQISEKQVHVKPNFVVDCNEKIDLRQRTETFIFAGRLDQLKGVDLLLEAWRIMGENAPKLIICGTGPMEEWCTQYITKYNVKNVEMKGFVPNLEVRKLIAKCKALIFPTQWYEGFPMSIIEAFSVGTPVVCSSIGNAGSIVIEGVSGVKFKHDSPEQLVLSLKKLNSYKDIYYTTLKEFSDKYTEEINYQILMDIYYNAI